MSSSFKYGYQKSIFLLKLPFVLFLIIVGFIFEFIVSLPLLILCELDNLFRKNT
jgi:hypothetical protein